MRHLCKCLVPCLSCLQCSPLPFASCLLTFAFCLLPHVLCLMSHVLCLVSHVLCLKTILFQ
ncbi:MAG: hypothetical protein EA364_13570 [Balneolaceae bacterium]|nr:MAG: hypothetical protein EA364_13570 [Balneolaceae bacterium]